jgi:hypothetical protein
VAILIFSTTRCARHTQTLPSRRGRAKRDIASRWKTAAGAGSVGGTIAHGFIGTPNLMFMRKAHDRHRLDQVDPDDSQLSV